MSELNEADFFEDPQRSIDVFGTIDRELVHRLTPEIRRLRWDDPEAPITVYIDSPGGYTTEYNQLVDLLFSADQNGNNCRIITVATGEASSNAARLLARGDYSIAYSESSILCHGNRFQRYEQVTKEKADLLSDNLSSSNELMATDFTRKLLESIIWRTIFFREMIDEQMEQKNDSGVDTTVGLPYAIMFFIQDRGPFQLIGEAIDRCLLSNELMSYLAKPETVTVMEEAKGKGLAFHDLELIRHIAGFIEGKLNDYEENNPLSKNRVSELLDLFAMRRKQFDTFFSETTGSDQHMDSLCNQDQEARLKELKTAEERFNFFFKESIHYDYFQIWEFATAISRILVSGENYLSAHDAYWLGIVDEVMGSDLPSVRTVTLSFSKRDEAEVEAPLELPSESER